jgi:hypothetical protein
MQILHLSLPSVSASKFPENESFIQLFLFPLRPVAVDLCHIGLSTAALLRDAPQKLTQVRILQREIRICADSSLLRRSNTATQLVESAVQIS